MNDKDRRFQEEYLWKEKIIIRKTGGFEANKEQLMERKRLLHNLAILLKEKRIFSS